MDVFVRVSWTTGGPPPLIGLSYGSFDITGAGGSWAVDSNPASPTYSLPYPWGAQSIGGLGVNPGAPQPSGVSGVIWSYGFLFSAPHPFPQNPATVWRAIYTAGTAPGLFNVIVTPQGPTGVYTAGSGGPVVINFTSSPGLGGQITIVSCYADCDGSGGLAISDFGCFQTKFASADPYADCDHNGSHTISDFGCFQAKFVAGCP